MQDPPAAWWCLQAATSRTLSLCSGKWDIYPFRGKRNCFFNVGESDKASQQHKICYFPTQIYNYIEILFTMLALKIWNRLAFNTGWNDNAFYSSMTRLMEIILIYDQILYLKIWAKFNFVLFFPAHFKYYIWLTLCSESLRLAFKGNLKFSTRERSLWEIWTYKNSYLLKHSHHQQTVHKNKNGYYSTCKEFKNFHYLK